RTAGWPSRFSPTSRGPGERSSRWPARSPTSSTTDTGINLARLFAYTCESRRASLGRGKEKTMSDNLKYVGVALVSAGVGAAVALLVAPDNGPATRRRLYKRMERERKSLLREGRRLMDDAKSYIDDQVEEGRKRVERTVEGLTEQALDQLDHGKRKISKMVGA